MRSETFFFLSLFSAPCHYPCLVTVFFYGEKAVIAVLNSLAKLASPFFHDATIIHVSVKDCLLLPKKRK